MIQAEAPPLREDADGSIRIGRTRVLYELVIRSFQDGATPEAIVQRYPTTTLAEIYAVVAHFLRHPDEGREYLDDRERKAGEVRAKIEGNQADLGELRRRILARPGA